MTEPRTVIVTGAGSGIGAATARRFSRDGFNTVLFGRTRSKLDAVAADLPEDRTLVIDGDMAEAEDVHGMIAAAVERFGALDVLVNNAGVGAPGRPGDLERAAWDKVIAVNVTGIYEAVTAALPHLRAARGAVVNVSSVSGLGGDWGMFAYNASKGAVSNMTRALAMDLAPDVRVNAVAPQPDAHRHDRRRDGQRPRDGGLRHPHPDGPARRTGGDRRRHRVPLRA